MSKPYPSLELELEAEALRKDIPGWSEGWALFAAVLLIARVLIAMLRIQERRS